MNTIHSTLNGENSSNYNVYFHSKDVFKIDQIETKNNKDKLKHTVDDKNDIIEAEKDSNGEVKLESTYNVRAWGGSRWNCKQYDGTHDGRAHGRSEQGVPGSGVRTRETYIPGQRNFDLGGEHTDRSKCLLSINIKHEF